MAVKVNLKTASGKKNEIIVINIHTPHLATEKKIMKKQIEMYLRNKISKNENKKIILEEDFNMDPKNPINWINRIAIRIYRMSIFNSKMSRFKELKFAKWLIISAQLIRIFKLLGHQIMLDTHSDKIVNHNYYTVLSEYIESISDTNTIVSNKILKTNIILNELKIIKPTKNIHKPELPKKIIKAIKKRRLAFKNMLIESDLIAKNKQFLKFKKLKLHIPKLIKCTVEKTWQSNGFGLSNKLVQDETEPKSHLAILINKLVNKAWNECNLIDTNNTSVVVPIFKNGNCQDPNNYRGISLILTLTKLIAKLLAIKLNRLDFKYTILCKEQAARRYAKSGFIEKRFIEECPFCRNIAPETIEHMLLECSRWQALRADILAQYINIYRAQVATKPPLLPASISMMLVGKPLGKELKLTSTRIFKNSTILCVKTTLATAKFSKRSCNSTLSNS
ncbi:hypothetical protein BB561_000748 [Smittium simulii]|uniref:Uncharacterized protein n=1 Tax=Smittium simulii TaxID=133385 RepID=A0A2T9YXV3_9FUNG|nr:hypothetical protein BB561_000748 [Smittium simulii]